MCSECSCAVPRYKILIFAALDDARSGFVHAFCRGADTAATLEVERIKTARAKSIVGLVAAHAPCHRPLIFKSAW